MKKLPISSYRGLLSAFSFSLLSVLTAGSLQAGGFGGPPPFTNGSPLPDGTDGVYQASARGKNLSGIISFTHSGGLQEPGGRWAIFYQGEVFTGNTDTAIMDGKISGVLEGGLSLQAPRATSDPNAKFNENIVFLTSPAGYFNASLNNNSPTGDFKGKGELTSIATVTTTRDGITIIQTPILSTKFKVKGVRAH